MHTQRWYATCPQGMSEKKRKDAYPKKVCHMLTWHVEIKDAYPKKVYHMLLEHVKKKSRKDNA